MTSKIMRRSGNAVTEYLRYIDFQPQQVILAGVGGHHEEVAVMRECWPEMELYGFEPNPDTFSGIKDAFPGILKNVALWSDSGPLPMHARSNWKDGSTAFVPNPEDGGWKMFVAESAALDDIAWIPSADKQAMLWLDCEGSELKALEGGRRFIDERVMIINIEMTCRPRMPGWPKCAEVHELLRELGFFHVWVHTIRPSIGQYDAIYVHRALVKPNMSCCPDSVAEVMRTSVLSCP